LREYPKFGTNVEEGSDSRESFSTAHMSGQPSQGAQAASGAQVLDGADVREPTQSVAGNQRGDAMRGRLAGKGQRLMLAVLRSDLRWRRNRFNFSSNVMRL